MSSSPPDQTALLKEVLEALKSLQTNQVQLASNVDAITGRVNVLAGMKEVRDIANGESSTPSQPTKQAEVPEPVQDEAVPSSPTLTAEQIEGEKALAALTHARKPSVTSRIILTCVFPSSV